MVLLSLGVVVSQYPYDQQVWVEQLVGAKVASRGNLLHQRPHSERYKSDLKQDQDNDNLYSDHHNCRDDDFLRASRPAIHCDLGETTARGEMRGVL